MQTNWIIEQLQVRPVEGNLTNVVITASWRANAVQDAFNATVYGSASFTLTADFTPLADLTEAQVVQWVWDSGVDQAATELNLQGQIDRLITPPITTPPLPWLTVEIA